MRLFRILTWDEIKLFLREPLTVVFAFGFPLVMLFVLAEVFGTVAEPPDPSDPVAFRGLSPLGYYLPGYVALTAAAAGLIMIPAHLAAYRESGVLRRFRAASIPPWVVFGSQVAVEAALSLIGGVLVIVAAFSVYDIAAPVSVVGSLAAFVITVAMFASVGVLLGAVMPSPRAAQGAGVMLYFVMMMLSGTGPPLDVMTPLMRHIGAALPLQHAVLATQDPWLGFGWNWLQLGVLAAITAVCGALAMLAFRRR